MSFVIIPKSIYNKIQLHCIREKPFEACGILGGRNNKVEKIYTLTNIEKSPKSYSVNPEEFFEVLKDLTSSNLDMLAIYHSHLNTCAYPSSKDIKLARYPETVYIIVSLAKTQPKIKGYKIFSNHVSEVKIIIEQ